MSLELETRAIEKNETDKELIKYKNISHELYDVHPIRMGLIASSDYDVPFIQDLIEKAELDIHTYCSGEDLPYRFEFEVGSNSGSDEIALSNTITFDTLGINLIVGHGGDSQCEASLNYANNNNMLLLSPGSSSYELAEVDNLYRLAPNETMQFQANAACMKELNISHVVVLAKRTEWARTMSKIAIDEFEKNSLAVTSFNFSDYRSFNKLSDLILILTTKHGEEHVAVQLIGHTSLPEFKTEYSKAFSVLWFGTSNTVFDDFSSWGGTAGGVGLFSPIPGSRSDKYILFREEVADEYAFFISYYGASAYDACWLYALSIIESGSTETEEIKKVILDVSQQFDGVSGYCGLNSMGDRMYSDYKIMGYVGKGEFDEFGYFYYENKTVEFSRTHNKFPS